MPTKASSFVRRPRAWARTYPALSGGATRVLATLLMAVMGCGRVVVDGAGGAGGSTTACERDSGCAIGPCNVCPSGAMLCLAPLAPVAALAAGGCQSVLPPCHPEAPPTCGPLGTFPVIESQVGIAYDGTNMWVADYGADVTELSPAGATIATFAAGSYPVQVAFDGANMWVTNSGSNSVTVLSPAGVTIGTFTVGAGPYGIAFDGASVWIANSGSAYVSKLSDTGATLGTFPVGVNAGWIAFAGTSMWVTEYMGVGVIKL